MIRKSYGTLLLVAESASEFEAIKKQLEDNIQRKCALTQPGWGPLMGLFVKKKFSQNQQAFLEQVQNVQVAQMELEKLPPLTKDDISFLRHKCRDAELSEKIKVYGDYLEKQQKLLEFEIDFPKGMKRKGERNQECIERELCEETGIKADELICSQESLIFISKKKICLNDQQEVSILNKEGQLQRIQVSFITILYLGVILKKAIPAEEESEETIGYIIEEIRSAGEHASASSYFKKHIIKVSLWVKQCLEHFKLNDTIITNSSYGRLRNPKKRGFWGDRPEPLHKERQYPEFHLRSTFRSE